MFSREEIVISLSRVHFCLVPFFYESSMITRNDRGEKKLSDVHAKKWICNIKKIKPSYNQSN